MPHDKFPGASTGPTTPTGPGDALGPSIEQGAGSSGLGPSVPGSSGLGASVEGLPTGGDRKAMLASGSMWKDASKKANVPPTVNKKP